MFRILSNGLAAVGLAAVLALVALMSGTASRPAEAAPGAITLAPTSSASCTTGFVASIPAADGTQTSVTFAVNPPSAGSFTATSVPLTAGAASTTFTLSAAYSQATVTASSGGLTSNASVVTANCATTGNCAAYPYNCGTGCDPIYGCGNSCYYGTVYTCGNGCYNGNVYGNNYGCGNNGCYNGNVYGCNNGCGVYSDCGACSINYYSGCGTTCANTIYSGCNNGCGANYYNAYGCVGNCGGTLGYQSCIPPTCGNINGPILNCSNSYVPSNNLQYVPGRVSILPSASTIACGGATAITVTVSDPNGFKVPDGTNVTFTTTLGYIQSSDQTQGGTAVGSLTIPPGTNGNAKVTASAGGQSADTTISVTCAAGAPAVAVQTLPAAPAIPFPFPFPTGGRPTILPPSTGDAGLLVE